MSGGLETPDCFFIDEGFGSLDQDSLAEVLDVLQLIEKSGKQIGIISHVKELTDRIPSIIQVGQLGENESYISY